MQIIKIGSFFCVMLWGEEVIVSLGERQRESTVKKEGCFGWHERDSEFYESSHMLPFQVLS